MQHRKRPSEQRLYLVPGTVCGLDVNIDRRDRMLIDVVLDGAESAVQAVHYPELLGDVQVGDRVWLNTAAVQLGLGSGGYHFVAGRSIPGTDATETMRVEGAEEYVPSALSTKDGHIMKLRYTPWQFPVMSVEEPDSPWREAYIRQEQHGLQQTPVGLLELHSQLLPFLVGALGVDMRAANEKEAVSSEASAAPVPIGFVLTDNGALPAAHSLTLQRLRSDGRLSLVVSSGHAFGGDVEAVNLVSGMLAARALLGPCLIALGMGPGIVGTKSRYGFSATDLAGACHWALHLGGQPVVVPRISFADPRKRHAGLSHHLGAWLPVIERSSERSGKVWLPLPSLGGEEERVLREQVKDMVPPDVQVVWVEVDEAWAQLGAESKHLHSMGRGWNDDPAFFLAAWAAGRWASLLMTIRTRL